MTKHDLAVLPDGELVELEKELAAEFNRLSRLRAIAGDAEVDEASKEADRNLLWARMELKRRGMKHGIV